MATSDQVTKQFLCEQCEERLCARGEDYVMSQCFRGPGTFPLREALEAGNPFATLPDGVRVYDLDPIIGSRVEDIIYFAVSVFWRASATAWDVGKKKVNRIMLGPYEERLRRFLVDESPIPEHVYLNMQVLSENDPDPSVLLPFSARVDHCWRHTFSIPGIFFFLFLGRTASEGTTRASLTTTGPKIVVLGGLRGTDLFKGILALGKKAPPRGSLKEWIKKRRG